MDSLYVYKGIVEWSPKWRRHAWRTSSGEVERWDLWEQILWERGRAGAELEILWVPLQLGVEGNSGADWLAEQGRQAHSNDLSALPKRRRVQPQLEALGLEAMSSESEEALDSGGSSGMASMCSLSHLSGSGGSESGDGTDVSDTRQGRCRRRDGQG